VRPQGINKGSTVKRIINSEVADFVLCIGDDTTGESFYLDVLMFEDEDMFKEVQKSHIQTKYTIAVGKKQASFSTYYVQNQPDVISLLNQLVQCNDL
jgi:trehalose-6-phosphatase